MKKLFILLMLGMASTFGITGLTGCEPADSGPVEEGAEELGDTAEEASDEVGGAAEEAADELEEATD